MPPEVSRPFMTTGRIGCNGPHHCPTLTRVLCILRAARPGDGLREATVQPVQVITITLPRLTLQRAFVRLYLKGLGETIIRRSMAAEAHSEVDMRVARSLN
jgi:hypothetical protein